MRLLLVLLLAWQTISASSYRVSPYMRQSNHRISVPEAFLHPQYRIPPLRSEHQGDSSPVRHHHSGNYGSSPNFFPAYVRDFFLFKSLLGTSKIRLEELKDTLAILDGDLDNDQTALQNLRDDVRDIPTMDQWCDSVGVLFQGKCYTIPNEVDGSYKTRTFSEARAFCFDVGGILAIPETKADSKFGSVLSPLVGGTTTTAWVDGVEFGGDRFLLPTGFELYPSNDHFPSPFVVTADYGLLIEIPGAVTEGSEEDWDFGQDDQTNLKPFVCEFKQVAFPF